MTFLYFAKRESKIIQYHADLTPAPAERQSDKSLILERAPDSNAKPAQILPENAKVERVIQVVIQPRYVDIPLKVVEINPFTPITIDLTLARMPDGGHRVVASSPDGEILGGVDIPVSVPPVRHYRNTAGISQDVGFGGYQATGVFYHYSRGAFIYGGALKLITLRSVYGTEKGIGCELAVGIRW
jgi:hypothetical protein